MLTLGIILAVLHVACLAVLLRISRKPEAKQTQLETPQQIQIIQAPSLQTDPDFLKLLKLVESMPQKVIESVTSVSSYHKGKLGELIGYLHLNSQYDKLIVLRDITDFIGIRFPKGEDPGTIDFIDIKNGQYARLTKDQMILKKIIEGKHIDFKKFKIETDANFTSTDTNSEP